MNQFIRTTLFIGLAVALSACESTRNYSKQLESERKKIDAWFARNGYSLQTECPADSAFVVGQWYRLASDGICFCIDSVGNREHRVKSGDQLNVRYKQSTLDAGALVISYWTTQDSSNPLPVTKGSTLNSCTGWDNAFDMMRFSGTEAQVIVPSKLGFSDAVSAVEPYYYKLKMEIVAK